MRKLGYMLEKAVNVSPKSIDTNSTIDNVSTIGLRGEYTPPFLSKNDFDQFSKEKIFFLFIKRAKLNKKFVKKNYF